jgi:carbon-monoxide dehydrogenase small subunit
VLLDGKAVLSCQTLAFPAAGKRITTIEGLERDGELDPLQQAFIDEGAVQCGYCTPGMILSAKALLDAKPDPSTEEIKQAIRGNLCRCTGYTNIVRAIKKASETIKNRERK